MKLRFFFHLFCFLSLSYHGFSQENDEYKFVARDSARGARIFTTIEPEIDEYLDSYDGEYKKEYKDLKKSLKRFLKREYSRIYFNEEYENYLKKVVSELVNNNPDLQKLKLRIYFSRIPIPNAVTIMDGTIFVYIGLLPILDSEAQLAMILGHELAHWQEKHSSKNFQQYHELLASEDVQQFLREAKKTRGNDRLEKLMSLSKSLDFTGSKHGRMHESESDSLSLTFLRNTEYDLDDAIMGVYNLKKSDTEYFEMNSFLKQTFDAPDLPFNNKWVYKKQSMSDRMKYTLTDEELDSLKTHPDPDKRYQVLQSQLALGEPKRGKKYVVSEETFHKMKRDFTYQCVDVLLNSNKYNAAMYYALNQQYLGDTSMYFKESLYKCLRLIHEKMEDHTLGRYEEFRNPYFSPEYNKSTIFIDNLSLADLEKIKENYKARHNIGLEKIKTD